MTSNICRRYAVEDLKIGMFVSSLDKPITQSPFPLEGFYIRKKAELLWLSKYCSFVVVNISRSKLARELSSTLQLEVQDIPRALTDPVGFRIEQRRLPTRPLKPRHKGRVKRLLGLLIVCFVILHFVKGG